MSETAWIIANVSVAAVAMVLTGIIIPQILLIAFRRKLFDGQDERKIHHGRVPRLGGIAFVPSIMLSMALVIGCGMLYLGSDLFNIISLSQPVSFCFAVCALMMLYLVGMADDLIGVKYRAKFVAQVLAALLICASGLTINDLDGFVGIHGMSTVPSVLFTVLIVVFIINSINLIDGIDGLASGLSAMALLCYGGLFFMMKHYVVAMLAFATLGSLVPFFYFNVMGDAVKKTKIFMGDTGSLTVGLILSFLAVEMSGSASMRVVRVEPIVLAFSPLLLPCFDVVRVFFHRLRLKQNPFLPDRCHIHHKLLALGMNQRWTMVIILFWSLLYAVGSIYMSQSMSVTLIFVIDFGSWVVINWGLSRAIMARKKRHNPRQALYQ